ncbi:MAG TPA: Rrf2 family transcriptional regulator [Candidatus Kapabacteria bacterium]|jgi:Rrf2 family protein|nr:Rrf2 family transcriptional regulator [Candidatus Kapabacteria bacterium]HOM04026.1 Rrf2 family transcriptional regulator [Candidatus Kapabacteria bacterium]HOQ49777.1 Rrf2 family transcriptional regulator [Candidatus Kapabacteria bacterium]HPU22617.1 Rrf2 family transcriptional regulator [Candidatus Kapabacteria bacterium]
MIKLSKKVEYAILALQYIAENSSKTNTAKEIAENLTLPYEFLSKLLQTLMKKGLLVSQLGVKGGYKLAKQISEITVEELMNALDERSNIVDCADGDSNCCSRTEICDIRSPIMNLQEQINNIFKNTTIANLKNNL